MALPLPLQLSTMNWVFAATLLVLILLVLLVAPYFGVYGTREIDVVRAEDNQGDVTTNETNADSKEVQ